MKKHVLSIGVIMMGLISCGEMEKIILNTACDANFCHGENVTYVLPPSVTGCTLDGSVITCNDIVINVDVDVVIEDNDTIDIDVIDRDGRKYKKRCKKHKR